MIKNISDNEKRTFIKIIMMAVMLMALLRVATFSYSQEREVPFAQDDRDRLIRLEGGQRSLEKQIEVVNHRIDDLNNNLSIRIDNIMNLLYVVIGGIIALVGFVIWDRRTALAPAIRKNKELEEREEKIERALKELANEDPKVAQILKKVGLL